MNLPQAPIWLRITLFLLGVPSLLFVPGFGHWLGLVIIGATVAALIKVYWLGGSE